MESPNPFSWIVKIIYSEKATKFCEIFTLLVSYVVPVKSKVKISQKFVAFSEYMNFMKVLTYSLKPCPAIEIPLHWYDLTYFYIDRI